MSKKKRVLPFDCTVEMLDEGYGMWMHPVGGLVYPLLMCISVPEWLRADRLRSAYCRYDPSRRQYYFPECGVRSNVYRLLPKIGDDQSHCAGDPYPAHWTNDPFTGGVISELCLGARIEKFFAYHDCVQLGPAGSKSLEGFIPGFSVKYSEQYMGPWFKYQLLSDYDKATEENRRRFDEFFGTFSKDTD